MSGALHFKIIDKMKVGYSPNPPALVMEVEVKGGEILRFAFRCHPDFDQKRGTQAETLIQQGLALLSEHPNQAQN